MNEAFEEAEWRARHGLFREYRETGEALRQIRDEHQAQWRPIYDTWTRYLNERLSICRQTAACWIRAAEVAADLSSRDDTLRLPVRHANLLGRFQDPEVRYELARKIQPLTYTEAADLVTDYANTLLNTTTPRPPKAGRDDEPNQALAQLDAILRGTAALDRASLAHAASRLGDTHRRRLARKTKTAGRALTELSASLRPDTPAS
ncbi:MAG TPA: hypothetical protein VFJ11_08350 [Gaiellaceae bacterium]|nr:hypothetical protein [Gaiellaceae bacterium]